MISEEEICFSAGTFCIVLRVIVHCRCVWPYNSPIHWHNLHASVDPLGFFLCFFFLPMIHCSPSCRGQLNIVTELERVGYLERCGTPRVLLCGWAVLGQTCWWKNASGSLGAIRENKTFSFFSFFHFDKQRNLNRAAAFWGQHVKHENLAIYDKGAEETSLWLGEKENLWTRQPPTSRKEHQYFSLVRLLNFCFSSNNVIFRPCTPSPIFQIFGPTLKTCSNGSDFQRRFTCFSFSFFFFKFGFQEVPLFLNWIELNSEIDDRPVVVKQTRLRWKTQAAADLDRLFFVLILTLGDHFEPLGNFASPSQSPPHPPALLRVRPRILNKYEMIFSS